MSLIILLALAVSSSLALTDEDYPLSVVTAFDSGIEGGRAGRWNLTGAFVYEQDWAGADQKLKIVTNLTHPSTSWVRQGFYQTYLQLREPEKSNSTSDHFSNFVCSMRYNNDGPITSSDMYQKNSCGTL